jgi:hypothetical protein
VRLGARRRGLQATPASTVPDGGWEHEEVTLEPRPVGIGAHLEKNRDLGDWRGETLSRMRQLIKEADPDVVEELKWVKPTNPGIPTWSHDGLICTGETYKSAVKLTFAKGARLKDPKRLFNASLEGHTRRAIDLHEGERIDETAFKALIREAVALNEPES